MQSQDPRAQVWLPSCDEVSYSRRGETRGRRITEDVGGRGRTSIEDDSSTRSPGLGMLSRDNRNKEKRANWYGHLRWMVGAQ
jgi:hypothetical protein